MLPVWLCRSITDTSTTDTWPTPAVHEPVTGRCSDGRMTATPATRHVPDEVSVVEVYGSKFLLEWLDRDVLAAAAAQHQTSRKPSARAA